jgi:hypothetical protein
MDIANTLKREVYRNLHFKGETVYSVRKDGLVEGHALTIIMDGTTKRPVTFAVGPKGNQRVRDEERKNVHAVIRGYMINAVWHDTDEMEHALNTCEYFREREMSKRDGYEWKQVTYNPYKYKTFVTIEEGLPVFTARKVIVGKEVWAQLPTEQVQESN